MVSIYVIGVGMTPFYKPSQENVPDYPELAVKATLQALEDANLKYKDIEQAFVGYVYGETCSGQRALYELGLTGIPILNVNNACCSGSSALHLAFQVVSGGNVDCVLALGFEKMEKGSLSPKFPERTNPCDKHVSAMGEFSEVESFSVMAQLFGNAGRDHIKLHGSLPRHLAQIAVKNRRHAMNNPGAQMREPLTIEDVLSSRTVHDPLTKLQCCPTSDGAAAVIICSEKFLHRRNLEGQGVAILSLEMVTDLPSTFDQKTSKALVGYHMTQLAAQKALRKAGIGIADVDVIELHDCFTANELITYEALELCPPGKAGSFIDAGDNTYGGKYVINPSGGLLSKGHPLGATGLAQCAEIVWQLRGAADKRQVDGAKIGLQHNIGIGGAAVVGIYRAPSKSRNAISPENVNTAIEDFEKWPSRFRSRVVFEEIRQTLKGFKSGLTGLPDKASKLKGVFAFHVKAPGVDTGYWIVDVADGQGTVKFFERKELLPKADVTISIDDGVLIQLMQGKLNPPQAFLRGMFKISGNMGLATKIKDILPAPRKAKL